MELRTPCQASLRDALALAARGWYVFPLRPGDKRPAYPDHSQAGCTGVDPRCRNGHTGWEARATTDPGRIERAWSQAPYNIGIACGPSGLVVVDLDTPKPGQSPPSEWDLPGVGDGGDVLAVLAERAGHSLAELVLTYTVRTGRGGSHLYYHHPADGPRLRNTAGTLGWLVDTRAHGGYVVAPGSVVDGRPYTTVVEVDPAPLPEWLAQRLCPAPLPPQRPVAVQLGAGKRNRYLEAAISASLDAIRAAVDGRLNITLYGASVALGQLVAGGALDATTVEDLLVDAAASKRHPIGQARRTVRSGFKAGARRPRSVAA